MTDFFVGQKVVCIDDTKLREPYLSKGAIYTIREICESVEPVKWPGLYFRFNEIHTPIVNDVYGRRELSWSEKRFKPVEYKAASIFRKIAQDVTDGKVLEIVDV